MSTPPPSPCGRSRTPTSSTCCTADIEAGVYAIALPRAKNPRTLSCTSGCRLFSEDSYLKELAKFGVTRRGFRAMLRQLGVPRVQIGDVWLVDHLSFVIAMRTITRQGKPDFVFAPSREGRKGRLSSGKRNRLPPEEAFNEIDQTAEELDAAKRLWSIGGPAATRENLRKAAYRMAEYGSPTDEGTDEE